MPNRKEDLLDLAEIFRYGSGRGVYSEEFKKIVDELLTLGISDVFLSRKSILDEKLKSLIETPALAEQIKELLDGPFPTPIFPELLEYEEGD